MVAPLWMFLVAAFALHSVTLGITCWVAIHIPSFGPYMTVCFVILTAVIHVGWHILLSQPLTWLKNYCSHDHLGCLRSACDTSRPRSLIMELQGALVALDATSKLLHDVSPFLLPLIRRALIAGVMHADPLLKPQTLTLLHIQVIGVGMTVTQQLLQTIIRVLEEHHGHLVSVDVRTLLVAWSQDDDYPEGPAMSLISGCSGKDGPPMQACNAALGILARCPETPLEMALATGQGSFGGYTIGNCQSLAVSGIVFDTVQRLALLNSDLGTRVLLSEEVYFAVRDYLQCELVDCVDFHKENGSKKELIYELIHHGSVELNFEQAFSAFVQQDIALAKRICSSTEENGRHHHFARLRKLINLYDLGLLPDGYCRSWVGWEFATSNGEYNTDCFENDSIVGVTINPDNSEASDHLRAQLLRRKSTVAFNDPNPQGWPPRHSSVPCVLSLKSTTRPADKLKLDSAPLTPSLRLQSGYSGRTKVVIKAQPNPLPAKDLFTIASPQSAWPPGLDDLVANGPRLSDCERRVLQVNTESSFESTCESIPDLTRPVAPHFVDSQSRKWFISNRRLGTGSFGTVYLGMNIAGALVAVKQVPVGNKMSEVDTMLKEIVLLSQLEHPNIVSYLGSQLVMNQVVIVMEFGSGGTLADIIADFNALEVSVVACYAYDILKGLRYLHSNQILHRDVKPLNVLVQRDGTCKLADFGTAGRLEDQCCAGTLYYMSPEAMRGQCDKGSDIWSFGVMLFQMLTMDLPFAALRGTNVFSTAYQMRMSQFQLKDMSALLPEAADLVTSCLQVDIAMRPTAKELLHHDFFVHFQADLNAHTLAADKSQALRLSQFCSSSLISTLGVRNISPRSRSPIPSPSNGSRSSALPSRPRTWCYPEEDQD